MMIDAKAQFALWAANPHLTHDTQITRPVSMPEWGRFDLDHAADLYRRALQKRAHSSLKGTGVALYEANFNDRFVIKQPGTMEVCMPSGLGGLYKLIDTFMKHDITYFTDTHSRLLELVFRSEPKSVLRFPVASHIDDDGMEVQLGEDDSLFGSHFLASRGLLVASFMSPAFGDGQAEEYIQAEPRTVMLYRGDTLHHRPLIDLPESPSHRILVRLLLRDPNVEYLENDKIPQFMPNHINRRVIDRLVYTIF